MIADALQVAGKIPGRGVPLVGVLGEQTLDDPAHGSRGLRCELAQGLGLLPDDRDERLGARLALECALARRHLVEDRAERELVGAVVDGLAARLFGRHVPGRAHDGAGLRRRRDRGGKHGGVLRDRFGELREPEVEDLDVAVLRDHQVLGLQIPVDDSGRVRLGEALGDLDAVVEQLFRRQGIARDDELAQRLALDELHRDVEGTVGLADVVDREDVRVVQRRCGARLELETLAAVRIRCRCARKDLDRDLAPERRARLAL